MTEAKNIKIYLVIFLTGICMCGNCMEEIAGRLKKTACVKQKSLQGVVTIHSEKVSYVKFRINCRKTLSGETFCLLQKRLLSTFKRCASSNLL